jgi:hypothetical protein
VPLRPQAASLHSNSAVPIRERMQLSIWKKQFDQFAVCLVNDAALPEAAFAFGRFLGQNMIGMGFLVYQFSRAGFVKSFGCCSVGLYFGHRYNSLRGCYDIRFNFQEETGWAA